ncbi:MAG: hypothetical protein ACK45I_06580 [Bacteroidota bacterium]|jgi:hypothetical protein
MSTCGYICPACEGTGYGSEGEPCHWCTPENPTEMPDETWIKSTHEGCGCSDEK